MYANQINEDGSTIVKQSGKCSHGGVSVLSGPVGMQIYQLTSMALTRTHHNYEYWSPHSSQYLDIYNKYV